MVEALMSRMFYSSESSPLVVVFVVEHRRAIGIIAMGVMEVNPTI
jgi:hypothetical protein